MRTSRDPARPAIPGPPMACIYAPATSHADLTPQLAISLWQEE